jgi:tRNA A-37 threonylcarbamoyl transferase component Bud32
MNAVLRRLPALATTGVGSLPFERAGDAARHAIVAYELPFCPQLPRLYGDMIEECFGADPGRCGWAPDRDRQLPGAWDDFIGRLRRRPPEHRVVKLQVTGPVTLAVALEQAGGHAIPDRQPQELAGEIATWLAVTAQGQIAALTEIGLDAILMVDEPDLASAGLTAADISLWDPLRRVGSGWGLHVCGRVPWELVDAAEPDLISFDMTREGVSAAAVVVLERLVARGGRVMWGVVDPVDPGAPADVAGRIAVVTSALTGWRPPPAIAAASLVSPSCGTGWLSDAAEHRVADVLTAAAAAARDAIAALRFDERRDDVNHPGPKRQIATFLRQAGLLSAGEKVELTPLTGGISSDLWKVDLPGRVICVKGALPQLKVSRAWFAPVGRNHIECEWLRSAHTIRPGHVPRVLAETAARGLFAMEYFPPDRYAVWKEQLFRGEVDVETARQVGDLLGHLHAASATDPTAPERFATDDNFIALRIDPYLTATAESHPDLADRLATLAERTMATRVAVVHGDVSPKNILVGPTGPVLVDAECVWFGDPAFDVAFCVNHLLIKGIRLPRHAHQLQVAALAFVDAHAAHVTWEPRPALHERVVSLLPPLALARIDGSSPVEYLDDDQRGTIRSIARDLLTQPASGLEETAHRWRRSSQLVAAQ